MVKLNRVQCYSWTKKYFVDSTNLFSERSSANLSISIRVTRPQAYKFLPQRNIFIVVWIQTKSNCVSHKPNDKIFPCCTTLANLTFLVVSLPSRPFNFPDIKLMSFPGFEQVCIRVIPRHMRHHCKTKVAASCGLFRSLVGFTSTLMFFINLITIFIYSCTKRLYFEFIYLPKENSVWHAAKKKFIILWLYSSYVFVEFISSY